MDLNFRIPKNKVVTYVGPEFLGASVQIVLSSPASSVLAGWWERTVPLMCAFGLWR